MRVFLFGLSPWGINLMNLSTELVQLVLSLLYVFLTWCLIHVQVYMLTTWFSTFSFDLNLSIHACLSLHDTWHLSHHSLGVSDFPRSARLDPGAWSLWILPLTDQRWAAEVWIIGRPSRALSFKVSLLGSQVFFFITYEYLLCCSYLYISLYSRNCAYRWCNIL